MTAVVQQAGIVQGAYDMTRTLTAVCASYVRVVYCVSTAAAGTGQQ